MTLRTCLWNHRNYLIVILTPILLLPLPFEVPDQRGLCGYMMILMGVYWCTEALPLAVTGMIPIFLVPMFGILTTAQVCKNYFKDITMMFTGGLIVAIGIEKSMLHKRIAVRVLMTVGTKPQWLMLGVMLPTWFLSMWISNTAATSMMLPIMEAVLDQLKVTHKKEHNNKEADGSANPNNSMVGNDNAALELDGIQVTSAETNGTVQTEEKKTDIALENGTKSTSEKDEIGDSDDTKDDTEEDEGSSYYKRLCKGMTLCVCYGANVGGVATLTGTPPNTIMKGFADDLWQARGFDESPITYTSWLVYGFPVACLSFVMVYAWLVLFYLGFSLCKCNKESPEQREAVRNVLKAEHESLGPIRFNEIAVGILFFILVLLWFFRSPGFMTGWASGFEPGYVKDAVPAILIACLLFVIPQNIPKIHHVFQRGKAPALLDWNTLNDKFPWSILFLLGGGFALAETSQVSGLSQWIGDQLNVFQSLPGWVMVSIMCLLVAILTEVTSNSATCTILMPIVAAIAQGSGQNPLYLMFPTAIATSFAFMLPVATPPNAIAFSYGKISVLDMIKAGAILNVLCVFGVTLANHTWGMDFFNLDELPWEVEYNVTTMATDG